MCGPISETHETVWVAGDSATNQGKRTKRRSSAKRRRDLKRAANHKAASIERAANDRSTAWSLASEDLPSPSVFRDAERDANRKKAQQEAAQVVRDTTSELEGDGGLYAAKRHRQRGAYASGEQEGSKYMGAVSPVPRAQAKAVKRDPNKKVANREHLKVDTR